MHRIVPLALAVALAAGCSAKVIPGTGHAAVGLSIGAGPERPVVPALAKQHTAGGAVAFARYYLDLVGWAVASDDWQSVEDLSDPGCLECANLRAGLERSLATNDSLRDQRIVVDSAVLLHHRVFIGAQYGVDVEIHSESVSSQSESPRDAAGLAHHVFLSIWTNWRRGQWTVFALTSDT